MSKQRVLFLCTGNSARSQMAEALLRRNAGDVFEIHSAGLEPKGFNPLTVKVMAEAGIDISHQTSKGIEIYLGKTHFHYLITVCDDADQNCPTVWPGSIPGFTGRSKTPRNSKAARKRSLPNSVRFTTDRGKNPPMGGRAIYLCGLLNIFVTLKKPDEFQTALLQLARVQKPPPRIFAN